MSAKNRRCIAASDKGRRTPASAHSEEAPSAPVEVQKSAEPAPAPEPQSDSDSMRLFVPITKANEDEQIIVGVVLQPEVVDAHGDIYDAGVIKKAAHGFLSNYNSKTTLGLQHKDFKRSFDLLESFLAPMDMAIGSKVVKAGSWVIVVRINESKIWKQVKDGKLTGFSIGGKAKAQTLSPKAA